MFYQKSPFYNLPIRNNLSRSKPSSSYIKKEDKIIPIPIPIPQKPQVIGNIIQMRTPSNNTIQLEYNYLKDQNLRQVVLDLSKEYQNFNKKIVSVSNKEPLKEKLRQIIEEVKQDVKTIKSDQMISQNKQYKQQNSYEIFSNIIDTVSQIGAAIYLTVLFCICTCINFLQALAIAIGTALYNVLDWLFSKIFSYINSFKQGLQPPQDLGIKIPDNINDPDQLLYEINPKQIAEFVKDELEMIDLSQKPDFEEFIQSYGDSPMYPDNQANKVLLGLLRGEVPTGILNPDNQPNNTNPTENVSRQDIQQEMNQDQQQVQQEIFEEQKISDINIQDVHESIQQHQENVQETIEQISNKDIKSLDTTKLQQLGSSFEQELGSYQLNYPGAQANSQIIYRGYQKAVDGLIKRKLNQQLDDKYFEEIRKGLNESNRLIKYLTSVNRLGEAALLIAAAGFMQLMIDSATQQNSIIPEKEQRIKIPQVQTEYQQKQQQEQEQQKIQPIRQAKQNAWEYVQQMYKDNIITDEKYVRYLQNTQQKEIKQKDINDLKLLNQIKALSRQEADKNEMYKTYEQTILDEQQGKESVFQKRKKFIEENLTEEDFELYNLILDTFEKYIGFKKIFSIQDGKDIKRKMLKWCQWQYIKIDKFDRPNMTYSQITKTLYKEDQNDESFFTLNFKSIIAFVQQYELYQSINDPNLNEQYKQGALKATQSILLWTGDIFKEGKFNLYDNSPYTNPAQNSPALYYYDGQFFIQMMTSLNNVFKSLGNFNTYFDVGINILLQDFFLTYYKMNNILIQKPTLERISSFNENNYFINDIFAIKFLEQIQVQQSSSYKIFQQITDPKQKLNFSMQLLSFFFQLFPSSPIGIPSSLIIKGSQYIDLVIKTQQLIKAFSGINTKIGFIQVKEKQYDIQNSLLSKGALNQLRNSAYDLYSIDKDQQQLDKQLSRINQLNNYIQDVQTTLQLAEAHNLKIYKQLLKQVSQSYQMQQYSKIMQEVNKQLQLIQLNNIQIDLQENHMTEYIYHFTKFYIELKNVVFYGKISIKEALQNLGAQIQRNNNVFIFYRIIILLKYLQNLILNDEMFQKNIIDVSDAQFKTMFEQDRVQLWQKYNLPQKYHEYIQMNTIIQKENDLRQQVFDYIKFFQQVTLKDVILNNNQNMSTMIQDLNIWFCSGVWQLIQENFSQKSLYIMNKKESELFTIFQLMQQNFAKRLSYITQNKQFDQIIQNGEYVNPNYFFIDFIQIQMIILYFVNWEQQSPLKFSKSLLNQAMIVYWAMPMFLFWEKFMQENKKISDNQLAQFPFQVQDPYLSAILLYSKEITYQQKQTGRDITVILSRLYENIKIQQYIFWSNLLNSSGMVPQYPNDFIIKINWKLQDYWFEVLQQKFFVLYQDFEILEEKKSNLPFISQEKVFIKNSLFQQLLK